MGVGRGQEIERTYPQKGSGKEDVLIMTQQDIDRLTLEAIRDYLDPMVPGKARILDRITKLNDEVRRLKLESK